MKWFFLVMMLLLVGIGFAQKRILVTDKVDVKDSIRLRGKSVAEISKDSQFLSPTHNRLVTQKAVRDYVNDQLGNVNVDSLVKAATVSGFLTVNSIPYVNAQGRLDARGFEEFGALGSAPSAPSAGFRLYGDASGRPSWRRADGFTRTFDASTITGNRVYTLQDVTGVIAMLEAAQTFTGVNTFSPSGSGGSGFTISTTSRFSTVAPLMTDAQVAAITGTTAGGWVYSSTQQRPYVHNGTAFQGVVLGPQAGFTAGQIAYGGTGGNLTSSSGLVYNGVGVGIGAASPTKPLMISGTTEDAFHITNTISGINARMGVGSGSFASSGWFSLQVNGSTIFTSDALNRFSISAARLNGLGSQSLTISGGFGAETLGTGIVLSSNAIDAGVFTATSGTQTNVRIGGNNNTWQPSSGNATFQSLLINPIFNTTGTYSGIARGIYYNPSMSSVVGLTHNAIETTAGNVIFNGGNVSTNGTLTVSGSATFNNTITATANGHRLGFLQLLTSGSPGTTGQGIVITGVDQEFQFKGTGAGGQAQIFSFGVYNATTAMKILQNTNPINGFIRVYGGFFNPNANNTVGALLHLSPQYDVSTNTGAKITGVYYNPTLTSTAGVGTHNAWESTSGDFIINGGGVAIGTSTRNASALIELSSTTQGFLGPRATNAQISAIASPGLNLRIFSTNSERQNIWRTGGWYQEAFLQDIKRDTLYKVVNGNLNLSGETTNFKNRYHTVRISTTVTAAATGNNTITMPVPHVDLLGINFKFIVGDTSGDSDISVISFGTDGTDGYLSNGDATYQSTQNLFPGLGVYVSVGWDENKGAYRWYLQ